MSGTKTDTLHPHHRSIRAILLFFTFLCHNNTNSNTDNYHFFRISFSSRLHSHFIWHARSLPLLFSSFLTQFLSPVLHVFIRLLLLNSIQIKRGKNQLGLGLFVKKEYEWSPDTQLTLPRSLLLFTKQQSLLLQIQIAQDHHVNEDQLQSKDSCDAWGQI